MARKRESEQMRGNANWCIYIKGTSVFTMLLFPLFCVERLSACSNNQSTQITDAENLRPLLCEEPFVAELNQL